MPFGSSAENKRLERTEFRQVDQPACCRYFIFVKSAAKIILYSCGHRALTTSTFLTNFRSHTTEALTQSCRCCGDPLTYTEIYAVKRSKFMRVPVLCRKSCAILYCQETKEVSNSDEGKSRNCSGYIGKASGSHFQVLVLNYLSLFAGML